MIEKEEINFIKGIPYDQEGKEIEVPEGYNIITDKYGRVSFVQVNEYAVEFVYRPPNYPGPIAMDGKVEE